MINIDSTSVGSFSFAYQKNLNFFLKSIIIYIESKDKRKEDKCDKRYNLLLV